MVDVSDTGSHIDTGPELLSRAEAEVLIRESINLVHFMAGSFCKTNRVEYEEAVADGMVGLVKAAQKFDVSRRLAFSTYASKLILNAMRDGVRSFHKIQRKTDKLTEGKPRSRVVSLFNDTWAQSIYAIQNDSDNDVDVFDLPDSNPLPLEQVCLEEDKRQLGLAIKTCLNDRQRFLIEQHYFHGVQLKQIAAEWGVSQERVWQIHQTALGKLRVHLFV